ncbi:MAG: hypothetical protein FK732_02940, partial [Asgard group archaeon]|nr:hypothetical protein [Asgard group archaeon]
MGKFIEQLKIYFKILRLNHKSTIIAFLGLGFSLALISEGLIFAFSFQYKAFSEYMGTPPTEQLTANLISFELEDALEKYQELQDIATTATETADIVEKIKRMDWFFSKGFAIETWLKSNGMFSLLPNVNLYGVPVDYFSTIYSLIYNGTEPQGSNQAIIVARNSIFQNYDLDRLGIRDLHGPVWGGFMYWGQLNITATIIKEDFLSVTGPVEFDFLSMAEYFSDDFMIMSIDNFPTIQDNPNALIKAYGRFSFYLEDFNAFNLPQEILQIKNLNQEIQRGLEDAGQPVFMYDFISNDLRRFGQEFLLFQLFGLLFIIPLVTVALYITNHSANLLQKRQKHHIASLLARGTSKVGIWFLALFQVLEITISGLILCFVIGYPFTWLMLKSLNFLTFTGTGIFPVVNTVIIYSMLSLAFVVSFFLNFRKLLKYSNLTIIEAQKEVSYEKPFWNKFYLDVFLLVAGICFWLIVKLHLKTTSAYTFAYIIGIIAPVCIIFGGILLSSRLYLLISKYFGGKFWNKGRRGIFGFAILRTNRRHGTAIRGLILFSLTFTLIFSALVSIESYNKYEQESAYYSLGSDILIQAINYNNTVKDQIIDLDGVESATYVNYTSQLVTESGLLYSYTIVGINTTEFVKTAYFEPDYLMGKDPNDFFNAINDSNDVIMQKDEYAILQPESSSNFTVIAEKYGHGVLSFHLDCVGIYRF